MEEAGDRAVSLTPILTFNVPCAAAMVRRSNADGCRGLGFTVGALFWTVIGLGLQHEL